MVSGVIMREEKGFYVQGSLYVKPESRMAVRAALLPEGTVGVVAHLN